MNTLEALLYGAVQGVSEYLPISSSAHLILLPKFLQVQDPGLAFDVFLHLGTVLATIVYFWSDWKKIIFGFFRPSQDDSVVNWKLLVIATIPAVIVGILVRDLASTVFRDQRILVWTLSFGGLALFLADHFFKKDRLLREIGWKDALIVGIAQCFALVPGVSRSGATITGGRLIGLDRGAAARFSFLMSGPITAGAVVFEMRHWDELVSGPVGLEALLIAGGSSFLFGLLAIGGLLRMLRRFGYLSFAIYRVGLAIVVWQILIV